MRIDVFSIFPGYFDALDLSLAGRARDSGLLELARPRPPGLDARPAPHGRRHAVRRRGRHGDEARALGRGARLAGRRPGRRGARRPDAGGGAVHPGGRPRPGRARAPGVRLREVRGDRPAGGRRRGRAVRGAGAVAGRLRAQRRRGGRAGHLRGRRPAAARVHGQRRTPSSRSRTRAACSRRPSTPSRPPGAASTSRRCCSAATTARSPGGAASSPSGVRRPVGPTCSRRRCCARTSWCAASSRGTPASCSRCNAPAGSRRSRPTPASRSPRSRSRSTTCAGGSPRARSSSPASHGRLVGAVRAVLRDGEWHVGRLMVAPDLQGSGLGRALLEAVEAEAPAEATAYALFTGAGSKRNQRMYKKAGYRLAGQPQPGRRLDGEAPDSGPISGTPDLWQTCASAQSAEGWPRTNEPGDLRRAPATGGADAAGYRHCLGLGHQLHTASIRG